MENLIEKYNVSRETFDKLKTYEASLIEWQNKFNLVSNNSLSDAWNRHFLDSVQLMEYIPNNAKSLLDFGSGAGFPAMVLAVLAQQLQPKLKITLIESIKKKTVYLNTVRKICDLDVTVVNDRIENLPQQKTDVITSRAMCNLSDLFKYAYRFTTKNTIMIFPKGKSYQAELDNAKKQWRFNYQIKENKVCNEGVILVINHLSPLKGVK